MKAEDHMSKVNKNPTELTQIQHEVLIGSMLGDGCLNIKKEYATPRLVIDRGIDDLPYLQWEYDIFKNLCRDKAITIGTHYNKITNKKYPYCELESRCIPAFSQYKKDWYPIKKKVVPNNITLSPLSIAVWLCDDGWVGLCGDSLNCIKLTFCTDGFTKDEVYYLKSLLDDRYNVCFTISKQKDKNQYRINGSDYQSRPLLQDIDSVFPVSMSRKSDVWRNSTANFYSNINLTQIRNKNVIFDLINELRVGDIFTIRSICEKLNYHTMYEIRFAPNSTIRNFIKQKIEEGIVSVLNNPDKIFSFNSTLELKEKLIIM